jgi:DNA invertase Pin-like site-specific DNA recombinase
VDAPLRANGVTLRILVSSIETVTPSGRGTLHVLGALAQFELMLMLERRRELSSSG